MEIQLNLWEKDYYDLFKIDNSFISNKRDYKQRVLLDFKFNYLHRKKVDFDLLKSLVNNKYSDIKSPKMLKRTLLEFSEKKRDPVSVYDMFHLYCSLNNLFSGKITLRNLSKWSGANRKIISRFGISQYNLLEKYLETEGLI